MNDPAKRKAACELLRQRYGKGPGVNWGLRSAPSRKDRTRRALVRRIMRDLYGNEGPWGYSDKKILEAVNDDLVKRGAGKISQATMRRARREEFGW